MSAGKNISQLEKDKLEPKLKEFKSILLQEGKGFLEIASENNDKADFQIAFNDKGEYEIWDPAGKEIPNLNPKLKVEDSGSALRVVQRLVHLTKYANIQKLDNHDSM